MRELSNMIDRNHKPPQAVMKLACRNELVSSAGSSGSTDTCWSPSAVSTNSATSTVGTGTTGSCDRTTSSLLLKAAWAANHHGYEPSNQIHVPIATAAGKLAERGDLFYESDHTVNAIVISANVYTATKYEGTQPE
jgi:hypothetical protein